MVENAHSWRKGGGGGKKRKKEKLDSSTGDEEPFVDAAVDGGGSEHLVGWDGAELAGIDIVWGLLVGGVCAEERMLVLDHFLT